jgi:hypothetical protein
MSIHPAPQEHDDYAVEPVPGLPETLPEGEAMLWQGAPDWQNMAWRVFHIREVVGYFALLLFWNGFSTWWESGLAIKVVAAVLPLLIPMALGIALLAALAYLTARMSVYTLTSKRVVIRIGIALPTTFNLPFAQIEAVDVNIRPDGTGDISIKLVPGVRLAYLVLWPHARPWALRQTQPTLRAVPDAARVAQRLGEALATTCPAQGMVAAQAANLMPKPRIIMSHVNQVDNILRQEDLTVAR